MVLLLSGLERLVHPLMLTCMGCFVGGVGFCRMACLATPAKLLVLFGCLEARRSCSGARPLGRLFIELANISCQRLAIRVDRGSCLESVSVSESRCSGESVCMSLRR